MSMIKVDELTDAAGSGSPAFPNGLAAEMMDPGGDLTEGNVLTVQGDGTAKFAAPSGAYDGVTFTALTPVPEECLFAIMPTLGGVPLTEGKYQMTVVALVDS